jgi:outer membrane protein assembly factor BamB
MIFPSVSGQVSLDQYEWTQGAYDPEHTRFSPGTMPNAPDVLWKASASMTGRGGVTIFDGKAFIPGSSALIAYDAFTGQILYENPYPARIRTDGPRLADPTKASWVVKIDDEYMYVYHRYQLDCAKIDTGEWVWSIPMWVSWGAGSGYYWHGEFDPETKTLYATDMGEDGIRLEVIAYDLSNPSQAPTARWRYRCHEGAEIIAFGEGKVFLSAFQASIYALDAQTGGLVWKNKHNKPTPIQVPIKMEDYILEQAEEPYFVSTETMEKPYGVLMHHKVSSLTGAEH